METQNQKISNRVNQTTKWIIGVIIIVVIVVVSYSIFKGPNKPVLTEPIKIGAILPLTGNQAAYGEGIKEGLELALNEINLFAPIKISIIYEDNNSETKNSVSAAQKLINVDRVTALIVGVSQHSLSVAPIAQEKRIVLFTMASQATALNVAGDYIFKNDDDLKTLGKKAADLMISGNYNKPAVIFAKYNDATVDAADAFQQTLEIKGNKTVAAEGFGKDEMDFKPFLLKIKTQNSDAIFVNGLQKDNSIILRQIFEFGMNNIKIFGNGAMDDPKIIENAKEAAEGIIFPTFQGEPTEIYKNKIFAKFGNKPKRWSVEAYDGLMILSKALNNISGEISPKAFKDELSKIKTYTGESGTIKFDDLGNAQRQLFLKTVKNGQFVPYEE